MQEYQHHNAASGYSPMETRICKLCLEENCNLLNLSQGSTVVRILQKHLRFNIAFFQRDVDFICYGCWQKVKEFDDFCNHIELVHQRAFRGVVQPLGATTPYGMPHSETDVELKPTEQQLQAAVLNQQHKFDNIYSIHSTPCMMSPASSCISSPMPPCITSPMPTQNLEPLVIIGAKSETIAVETDRMDNGNDEYLEPTDTDFFDIGTSFADGGNSDSSEYLPAVKPRKKSPPKRKIAPISKSKAKGKDIDQQMFVCELCGHTSKSKGVYDNHYETKHMNNVYTCDVCGEKFRSKHCIYTHMRRIHIRKIHEQFMECKLCGKKVSMRCFRNHMERHDTTHVTRYKCFMCDKGFMTKDKLREHETIHTGELPLKCSDCDKRFRFSSSLSLHRKKMHRVSTEPPKKYKCYFCENVYSSPSTRYTHRKRHHPNETIPLNAKHSLQ